MFLWALQLLILLCPLGVHNYYRYPETTPTTQRTDYIPYPEDKYKKLDQEDITKREIGAILQMTVEFLKDMDMKMRDVNRIEKMYVRSFDFGSGKLYQQLESLFDHMQHLYKNTCNITVLFTGEGNPYFDTLLPNVVGSLQFMLGDYMEFLSVTEVYRERYHYYKSSSRLWDIREAVAKFLRKKNEYPFAPGGAGGK